MSEFYKKFLLEDPRRLNPASGRGAFLAAFGKHPGWDDHVEDLGLETESLIFAKTLLYVQGIGGQIDSGAWEKLEPAQQIPAFKHVFVWQRAGQFIIGRMWSSSDGKGRTRYPLVVCAHFAGIPLAWALEQALPRLEKIEEACQLTRSAADVRALLDRYRNELRGAVDRSSPEVAETPLNAAALGQFVARPELGPQHEGWFRILYQLQSQMSAFAPGKFSLKGDLSAIRPQQMRVPPCGDSPAQIFQIWSRFFLAQADPATPLFFTLPLGEAWLDVTMGEPTPHEIYCLRASAKALPLANEVPYNLDAEFRTRAETFLTAFQSGETQLAPLNAGTSVAAEPAGFASTTQRWFKWMVGGGAALLVVLLAIFFLTSGRKEKTAKPPTPESSAKNTAETQSAQPPAGQKAKEETAARDMARLKAEAEARRQAEEKRLAQEKMAAEQKARDETARLNTDAEARRQAGEKRLAEEKLIAGQKAKTDAEVLEKARLASEADASRVAEEKRLAEEKMKAEQRTRNEAVVREVARLKAEAEAREKAQLVAAATPAATPATRDEKKTADPKTRPEASARRLTNSIGMVLVQVPGNYWVGQYEVTQAEYKKVMNANPSRFNANERQPVENVSWTDAVEFCARLTAFEKKAGTLPAGATYTLPTQKQWDEFVADANLDDAVITKTKKLNSTAPVGSTQIANQYGLYDVLGNVWEWCLDEPSPAERVSRGLAWNSLKSYKLKTLDPNAQAESVGFRCVLVP